ARDSRRRSLYCNLARAHQLRLKAVGAQLVTDLLERHELARLQLHNRRHDHPLPAKLAFTPRAQMLLEKYALVRHVLVDDPKPFAVHRDNETAVHLPQRLQIRNRFRRRERAPGFRYRSICLISNTSSGMLRGKREVSSSVRSKVQTL